CVDVSNEKAIDATSNALSTLNSTVTQQGKDITSNSNSITSLSNQMVNGRQNMWVRSVYNVQLANNTTEPTFSDINGKAPISIDEVPDAAKLDFASAGSYVIAHYKAFVKVNADTTITMAPGSRVFDDTGAVYVNGVRVAFGNASWNTVSFDLKAGWSTVEFLVNQWTGQAYINLGFKLSEKVAQLNSALGMNALSNAISAVTSNVSTVGDRVTSTSQSVTDLRNSLEQTNANLANKADAQALSTLQNTVSKQGDTISSQGNSITKLTNDLEAADANIAKKADQSAVTTLTGRVEKTESGLTAANSNITSLSSSLSQQSKRGANLLPDGTFESYAVGHNLSNNRVIVTTDDSHGGNKCIRVTRPNDYNANATDNSDNHIFSGFQVRDNAVFYMECWVKRDAKSTAMAENAQISIGLSLQYQDNSWQWPAVTKAAKDLSSTQWTKVSGYLKSTKSGIKQAMVRISIPNVSSVKAGNSFLIDDLVITEVTDAYNAQSTADANANAISTLDSTVSQQGDQITSQGNSITKLTNDLATTNNNVSKKADQSALSVLSGRVDQTESGLSSANSSITALNSSVRAGNATSGDLISNPTFDPEFSQMGFTVVSSSSEGVPANCPYAYVARIAARDHHPNFAAIPATLGDVYEMSALVACGAGSADFNLYLGTATRPSGSVGAPLSSGGNRKASATWQRVTWRFKITQGIVDRGFFRPFLQINQSSPFGTVWYVTDWHLRNVTDSSKVQDSLDATAKAVDSLTSTVNQQGENISSIGTRTTNLENNLRTTNANVAQKADANALTALTNRVTQTEKDINSTSSSVTNLNNKVDAISVGGTNLIKNSGDMTGWSNVVSDTYRGNAVIGATVKAGSGYKDLREITLESPVDAGEYVYSFYAKGGVTGQTMTAFFYNPNTTTSIETSQGAKGNNSDGRAQFTLTTSWARYWVKWKQTPSTGTKRLILCRIESNTSKDQTVYINSPKFEVGNVVSDWNESPSDSASASAVDSLTTKVNQQGTSISSIGNRTTSLENGLSTAQNNIARKADASALQDLRNTVTQQGKDISSQGTRVTSIETSLTTGANLIPNAKMLNDAQGWAGSATTVDGYAAVNSAAGWQPQSATFEVTPGDILDLSMMCLADQAITVAWGLRFDGPSLSNVTIYASNLSYQAGEKKAINYTFVVPAGATTARLQRNSGTTASLTIYNVVVTRRDAVTVANSSAIDSLTSTVRSQGDAISSIGSRTTSLENSLKTTNGNVAKKADSTTVQTLQNTVTQHGESISAAGADITSMKASLTRRTVFTVTALGLGSSLTPGVFDESGKNLFTPGRSWALVTFAKHSDGSTVIATSKTYDVFGSANNGATMSADIEALASGTYVCVLTFDEPSGNRGKILSALESLGGTSEVVNSLPYRGAYILLGRKGMKPGDGLELRAPTGGDGTAHISTSVEFVNGVMMGLGAAGGVMMKADANASAITTLQNTVKTQGDNIDSLSSSTTALENSLASSNASVDAASQIPGNLIVNPSFERGTEGYTGWSGIATVVTLQVPHLGTKAAKLAAGGSAGVGQKISFKKDRSYKIGIWAKQDPNTTIQSTDNTKFRVAEGNGLIASKAYGPFTSNWQEVSWTWKATKDVVADVQFTAFLSAGAMYFDDFYVVDVTDSVETQANSSAITKLDSRVTKTENDITSQGSQVTQLKNDLATTNTNVSKKADAAALTALTNRVTQNEKEIETQSSQTTSLKNSLSTVQAMGSNPWFDGSLETYSENQQISGSRAVVVSSQKRSGTKSLRVSRGAGEGGNSDKTIGKWIALRENAVFRIELWAMMPADQSPSSGWSTLVGLQTQNAANNNNWPTAITINEAALGARGAWKKFTGTLRVAAGHTRGAFWVSTRGTTGTGTPGYDLYIDDVVVTDITDAKEAQDSANANASALTSLTSRVTYVEGQVTSQASQLSSLTSQVNDASSKVDQMAQTITNNEKTQSSLNTSLQSQIDAQASANIKNQTELNNATTSLAAIKSTQQTQATTISALSQQQTNLTAQVGGQSAELQELKKTVVENGNVNSTWMVKMETNSNGKKYAAGIALGIDGKNLQSQFLVQADRFGLINTSNGNTTTPFVVENGVAYMNAAVIKDGSITNAKIGSEIRSDNFVDGSRGWRVGKDGSSQFHNVIVRGHVEAESGSFKGTIDATDGVFRGTVQASRFVGDICSAGVFKQGVRPDITHYDSGSVGGTKTYVVSGTVACDVNFVGRIMVWIKGVKVSEFSVGAAASNATTRYIPAVGSLSGVTDQNVRCEITVEGSGIYNYVGGFALMTRSSGSWA
ncbi:TPA: DUF1983 domain-containing protein, partial [Klebsiella pneumoniae]|nr:DUF1983 domain-containing protein [Klebsiella pneumoniae]